MNFNERLRQAGRTSLSDDFDAGVVINLLGFFSRLRKKAVKRVKKYIKLQCSEGLRESVKYFTLL